MATKNDDGECASKKRKEGRTGCIVKEVNQCLGYKSIISMHYRVLRQSWCVCLLAY